MSTTRPAWRRLMGAVLLLTLLLSACGTDTDISAGADEGTDAEPAAAVDGDDVSIEYFTFSAAPDHLDTLQGIIDAFEAENPGVSVEVTHAPYDEYFTRLQTRVAGGQAPDTFELNFENFVTYAESGALLDPSGAVSFDEGRFYPEALGAFQRDGAQLGLPISFANVVLFYNADLFDAAGLDYPDESWTWDDELAAAQQLTDADAGVWGTYQPVSFFEFFKVLAQNGGQFFDDSGDVAFDSPEGVEAAEWLIDRVGTVTPTEADLGGQPNEAVFADGRIAMWHSGIWMFSGMEDVDFTWDVTVEPGNTQDASHFFANAVVASATTEHEEAAGRWMEFLAGSDAAVDARLDASWELPAVADASLFAPYLEQTPPENREAVFASLDAVVVPPVIEQQQQMQDAVDQALQQALLGQLSVEEALAQAAEQVRALR